MSEQIREQVSAFLDGELPSAESELLLKRLTRDPELRESFGRYALIGESLRGVSGFQLSHGFHARVNRAIDGEPALGGMHPVRGTASHWWRPLASAAVAAGVAAVAVVALQQRAVAPSLQAALAPTPREALSYTVPATVADAPTPLRAARLTNYVFAHSTYSSVLGQSNVLSGLLADGDEEDAGTTGARGNGARAADAPTLHDVALKQTQSRDARVTP